ncbi:MAG: hypothetical protein K0R00_937 [Herbinix sp.]|nr:hypothetical protein [Herbinix sp.]
MYLKIKEICKKRKVSISQMERDLEFPRGYLYKWTKSDPGSKKLNKVADYLGVSVEEISKDASSVD